MEAITLEQQILSSIRTFPVQQQHEVLNFAQFLHQKAAVKPPHQEQIETNKDLTLDERRAFLHKPLAERRAILAQQAEEMLTYYQSSDEWRELMAGDIIND